MHEHDSIRVWKFRWSYLINYNSSL
jgi:hypothetical protein